MKYLLITLDAIEYLATIRQYQNIQFQEAESLYKLLTGNQVELKDQQLKTVYSTDGIILHTQQMKRNEGVVFDFTSFDAFNTQNEEKSITIFQKIIKYAIKYFGRLSLAPCEKELPGSNVSIIYPFPFSATKNAYKILVDRNSSKHSREDKNYLTVFYCGHEGEGRDAKVSFTSLNKALKALSEITLPQSTSNGLVNTQEYSTTILSDINLGLDSRIGYEHWQQYLTTIQKKFVQSTVNGVERLEGAAGTGKTLSMVLRCIHLLRTEPDKRIIFVTHSKATRDHIIDVFINNWPEVKELLCTSEDINKSLLVTTLQEWCIKFLGVYLSETEYLDKDASESKIYQLLYIEEAAGMVKQQDWNTYKCLCSDKFVKYIELTDSFILSEMIQYEIATIIKGRAEGNLDTYLTVERSSYAIPCHNEYDRHYLFLIYKKYQSKLESVGQYDSDDIILTALGQLKTPIWKRRRNQEGFDICFIDETHLFNLNELSIFHYLNKDRAKNNIVFAIDNSQHVGERAILDDTMYDILKISEVAKGHSAYNVVFRSSADIINLAYNVLASGSAIFDHMENPLIDSNFVMTRAEEEKCIFPEYKLLPTDDEMISAAFEEADKYAKQYNVSKSNILIAATTAELVESIIKYAENNHKACSIIKSRGDVKAVTSAYSMQQYVIGGIDYVGGLEFDYVILLGVDDSRVPPKSGKESNHFLSYAWYNRMYVAITRAKYALLILGNKGYGYSNMLESAIYNGIVRTDKQED